MEGQFLVGVICLTYNHSAYIEDAMDGFTMQQTNFPYVCCIIDDASTDGEPEVIRHYLIDNFDLSDKSVVRHEETDDYILCFARHTTNRNCFFVVLWLKYNHYGKKRKKTYYDSFLKDVKYIAFCEGDDYWLDPLKLKKQVSFLEENPDYGLIYTNHFNNKDGKITKFKEKGNTEFHQIVLESGIGTLTACCRLSLYNNYLVDIQPHTQNWKMGDAPLWKYIAYHSKIKFLPDYTAVYRILPQSASHFLSPEKIVEFTKSSYDVQLYFIDRYVDDLPQKEELKNKVTRKKNVSILDTFCRYGKTAEASLFLQEHKEEISLWLFHNIMFKNKLKRLVKKLIC